MKPIACILSAALAVTVALGGAVVPGDAEARRFGGGGGAGLQRTMPRAQPPAGPAATPATPAPAAAAAAKPGTAAAPAAAAGGSRWLGPIAGLAAGLGIAALFSALGLGAGLANLVTMLLIAAVAFVAIRFLLRRFAGGGAARPVDGRMAFAGQGAAGGQATPSREPAAAPWAAPATGAVAAAPVDAVVNGAVATVPADFDATGFTRLAKMIFIRLQAANDAGDLDDLRRFTTPELFASVRLDLQERGPKTQRTDVVQVDADVLDVATEADRQLVTVRFNGLIREEADGVAEPFDELWHFARPADGSRDWAIAGIQQAEVAA